MGAAERPYPFSLVEDPLLSICLDTSDGDGYTGLIKRTTSTAFLLDGRYGALFLYAGRSKSKGRAIALPRILLPHRFKRVFPCAGLSGLHG